MAEERNFDERLAAIARGLVHEPDMPHTLQRIVELAAATLDGEVSVSVSLVRRRQQVQTAAASDERATRADQLQYELGEGPCLDAIWQQNTVQIDDMTTAQRYSAWSRRVAEQTGIRSSLSLQLFTNKDSLGALNLYSPQLEAFDAETRGEGLAFAAQAAVALRSAQDKEDLRIAMTTRNLIGQSQGILMERYKMTAEQAFAVLSRVSQQTNVKLRDVAQRLVDTGEIPGPVVAAATERRPGGRPLDRRAWVARAAGLPAHRDPALPGVIGFTPWHRSGAPGTTESSPQ